MLLNEFLKEHCKVETLEATVAKLESTGAQQKDFQRTVIQQQEQIERLTAALEKQASQIQKVSAQLATGRVCQTRGLQLSGRAQQTVVNNQ
jgi:predicted RNase H-like nuclease (RuvC/YqgF family)